MGSLKPITAHHENTAGKRAGMNKGAASAPVKKAHGSSTSYASFAKTDVRAYGQSKKSK
jgi:hypothetical protein